jgi:hypothetical protein
LCDALVGLSAEVFEYSVLRVAGAMDLYQDINEAIDALAILMTRSAKSDAIAKVAGGPERCIDAKKPEICCLDGILARIIAVHSVT